MFRISSSVEYGMRIMLRLAGELPGDSLSAEKISVLENIPRDYLDQILQQLRKRGLVVSRRGAYGGYALDRSPSEIPIGLIIRALEETAFEKVCERYSEGSNCCTHTVECGIKPVWQRLTSIVNDYLDKVTLAQIGKEPANPLLR